jgi:hypothetical protein
MFLSQIEPFSAKFMYSFYEKFLCSKVDFNVGLKKREILTLKGPYLDYVLHLLWINFALNNTRQKL